MDAISRKVGMIPVSVVGVAIRGLPKDQQEIYFQRYVDFHALAEVDLADNVAGWGSPTPREIIEAGLRHVIFPPPQLPPPREK